MSSKVFMIVDIDRCWGCRACEIACKQELGLATGYSPLQVISVGPRQIEGTLHRDGVPVTCMHCTEPECMKACRTDSIFRNADGTIQIDTSACIGCKACQDACPYGAIGFVKGDSNDIPVKCTLCSSRRSEGLVPSCAQHCLGRALTIVNEDMITKVVGSRYSWSNGQIVYVSSKWAELGKKV